MPETNARASGPERISSESVQELWERYRQTAEPALRDRLVLSLAPMVKYIAYRKLRELPVRAEIDDFISVGLEALLKSIDRYDPQRGTTLEQFAWSRIQGAVLDELRRNDWAPRSLRRWERDLRAARNRFITQQGRPPSREELAAAVGVSQEELDERLSELERSEVGSLNVRVLDGDDAHVERIDMLTSHDRETDPERSAMRENARRSFRKAFGELDERERQVAILLYLHSLTLREIGQALGVSESRVCQIHSRLRRRLRDALAGEDQLFLDVA